MTKQQLATDHAADLHNKLEGTLTDIIECCEQKIALSENAAETSWCLQLARLAKTAFTQAHLCRQQAESHK